MKKILSQSSQNILLITFVLIATLAFNKVVRADDASVDCSSRACFTRDVRIGQSKVPLLGSKLFRYYFWTAYSIALYAPSEARNIDKILSDIPKKLVLEYRRDFEASDIIEAANQLLQKNPDVNLGSIKSQLDQINKLYLSVKEGDRYALEYEPGKGTTLILNERVLGTVEGSDFARDYFGIWLGRYPIDDSMRDNLLGVS